MQEVTEEHYHLWWENADLQAEVDQVTWQFRSLWPIIIDANKEALTEITTCTFINCCDHIRAACSNLVATNADMKRKLEMVRSTLPNPREIYTRTIEGKITEVEAKKQALAYALMDGYTMMNKVCD